MPSTPYSDSPWSFFKFMRNLVARVVSLIYLDFIYTFFYFINLKDICVYVMQENAEDLDKELNLIWPGFLGMIFEMLLEFQVVLIDSKCCIHCSYSNFFFLGCVMRI